ncbi:MAG: hypothetical protein MI923_30825, partial [Phycisphaerales bacterium]|nr:hypothetical protein [Phycisphaerales bacterium]
SIVNAVGRSSTALYYWVACAWHIALWFAHLIDGVNGGTAETLISTFDSRVCIACLAAASGTDLRGQGILAVVSTCLKWTTQITANIIFRYIKKKK